MLSESEWESYLGGTQYPGGYNMGEIRWTDLGRKYIIKKGKKSILPDFHSAEKTYR